MIENLLHKLAEADTVKLYDEDGATISSLSVDEIDAIRLALTQMSKAKAGVPA